MKSGTALVLAHLDHKLQSAASPEAVFAQKRVMCLDDFYQGAQVVFNLQLPSAAMRGQGKDGQREARVIIPCPQERRLPPSCSASLSKPIPAEFKGVSEV